MNTRDEAWERIFEAFHLLDEIELNGAVKISASDLKKFYEPRLLAKIDHAKNLPGIFREYGVGILPLSVNEYLLGQFNLFQGVSTLDGKNSTAITKELPSFIQSVDTEAITSEQTIIHAAVLSGVLSDFVGEEIVQVNSGRMRTGEFNFEIDRRHGGTFPINVRNAQIEIDAGFETPNSLVLLEAKNRKSVDFNIRQLYYPYRTWSQRLKKPIRNLFMSYEKKDLQISEFVFENPKSFSSIRQVKSRQYLFSNPKISREDLIRIYRRVGHSHSSSIHFPQANNFQRLIDFLGIVSETPRTHAELADIFGFDGRQAKYYSDAALYLGLAEERKGFHGHKEISLSPLGNRISHQNLKQKNLMLAELLLSIDSVGTTFEKWFESNQKPTNDDVSRVFNASRDSLEISGTTIGRRASTVKAWAAWLIELIN